MDRGAWWATVHGCHKESDRPEQLTFSLSTYLLAITGDGQRSLACCSPWGHEESDMTE